MVHSFIELDKSVVNVIRLVSFLWLSAPIPAAGHHRPTPPLETPGPSQASLGQSPVGWLLLSPGSWYTRFCLCPPRVCFPVLRKFWWLSGGLMATTSKELMPYPGLLHPEPLPHSSPLLTRTSSEHTQTRFCLSLWGLWVLVRTRYVWVLWVSLGA